MNDPTKWWLISDEDVREIAKFLRFIIEAEFFPAARLEARAALHTLETGLHQIDAIPADFAEPTHDVP